MDILKSWVSKVGEYEVTWRFDVEEDAVHADWKPCLPDMLSDVESKQYCEARDLFIQALSNLSDNNYLIIDPTGIGLFSPVTKENLQ